MTDKLPHMNKKELPKSSTLAYKCIYSSELSSLKNEAKIIIRLILDILFEMPIIMHYALKGYYCQKGTLKYTI